MFEKNVFYERLDASGAESEEKGDAMVGGGWAYILGKNHVAFSQ
jgi:hypothetical protein